MEDTAEPLADIAFTGTVIEWRGPAPFYFVAIPEDQVGEVHFAARISSYGWGCVPVTATIGGLDFTTSLFPRDGGYLLPLKLAIRKPLGLVSGDAATVRLQIYDRRG